MMTTASKMICPNCRVEMNHHCDKLVYPGDSQQMAHVDYTFAGIMEEFHTCPKCGGGASRHAGA
jgi:ribosomal protein S27AE